MGEVLPLPQVSGVPCVPLEAALWLESTVRALNVHYHFLI